MGQLSSISSSFQRQMENLTARVVMLEGQMRSVNRQQVRKLSQPKENNESNANFSASNNPFSSRTPQKHHLSKQQQQHHQQQQQEVPVHDGPSDSVALAATHDVDTFVQIMQRRLQKGESEMEALYS